MGITPPTWIPLDAGGRASTTGSADFRSGRPLVQQMGAMGRVEQPITGMSAADRTRHEVVIVVAELLGASDERGQAVEVRPAHGKTGPGGQAILAPLVRTLGDSCRFDKASGSLANLVACLSGRPPRAAYGKTPCRPHFR